MSDIITDYRVSAEDCRCIGLHSHVFYCSKESIISCITSRYILSEGGAPGVVFLSEGGAPGVSIIPSDCHNVMFTIPHSSSPSCLRNTYFLFAVFIRQDLLYHPSV